LPFLMLTDYYLTILSVVLKDKKLSKFVVLEEWELNPRFQEAINQKKLVNVTHLLLTVLISFFALCMTEINGLPRGFISFILGALLIKYGVIVGGHISNILWSYYVIRREDQISGQIRYTYEATLFSSMPRYLLPIFPLIIIYIYTRSLFVLGGICGILLLMINLIRFAKMMRKKKETKSPKTQDESIK